MHVTAPLKPSFLSSFAAFLLADKFCICWCPAMPGFIFVHVPALLDKPIEALLYPEEVTKRTDVRFIRHLRMLFGHELKEVQPIDPKQKEQKVRDLCGSAIAEECESFLQRVECEHLDLVLALTSIDTLVLTLPTLASNTKGVSLYHDGKCKNSLPLNERATDLIKACGLVDKKFYGSCYLTRIEEFMESGDMKPSWRRCDFTLRDCSSDATWVNDLRTSREQSGKQTEEERKWFESLPDRDSEQPRGETQDYLWSQTDDEIEICFKPEWFRAIRAVRRDITVRICPRSLYVRLRGSVLLDVELRHEVKTADSCWVFTQASTNCRSLSRKQQSALVGNV
uniref:CS domain-containing protein n=1 Tax=Karlodinium veneficum TaxID=407301 RepID=E8Z751_KARVE|nr:unknown [Karlodinium veneficum]